MADAMVTGVLRSLRELADPARAAGMARAGIRADKTLGVRVPDIRRLARDHKDDHELALALWQTGIHEARLLAPMVDDAAQVTAEQAESWAAALDSWDICDRLCINLLCRTPLAWDKAVAWTEREEEFVKRAGFALIAVLAVHDKKAADERFLDMLPLIEREAGDDRNFVKKAVNWALRHIGKRNSMLNEAAIAAAERIAQEKTKAARWIASDALRELRGEKVQKRLGACS